MKREKIIAEMKAIFGTVKFHPELIYELIELINKTGNEAEFIKLFKKRISQLELLGLSATKLEEFEKLKGPNTDGLYSMHLSGKRFNIRIIYSYNACGEALLHSFYKRDGSKTTDYTNHIPIAYNRKKEMERNER